MIGDVGELGGGGPTFNDATKSAVSNNVNFEILSTISPILGSATGAVLCHRLAIIGIAEEEHVHLFAAVATAKRADRVAKDILSGSNWLWKGGGVGVVEWPRAQLQLQSFLRNWIPVTG